MSQQIQELEPLFQPLEALSGIIWEKSLFLHGKRECTSHPSTLSRRGRIIRQKIGRGIRTAAT